MVNAKAGGGPGGKEERNGRVGKKLKKKIGVKQRPGTVAKSVPLQSAEETAPHPTPKNPTQQHPTPPPTPPKQPKIGEAGKGSREKKEAEKRASSACWSSCDH